MLNLLVASGSNVVAQLIARNPGYKFHREIGTSNAGCPVADFDLTDAGGKETETPRERALSAGELAALLSAMRDTPSLGRVNEFTFKRLLALCVCKGELVAAR